MLGRALQWLIGLVSPRRAIRTPLDTRPADGIVDIAVVSDVATEPNAVDPRWRRFTAIPGDTAARPRLEGCSAMLGKVVFFSVFVGRDGRGWTDAEIAQAHGSLIAAGNWIEREAARIGAPMNIELADTYFAFEDDHREPVEIDFVPEGDTFAPMEAGASRRYLGAASRSASELGFADLVAMMAAVNRRVEADSHAWLFHHKSKGRSIAIDGDEFGLTGVGMAVCFARESSFPEPLVGPARVDPTTVVHEVLHLFGASDKYGVPLGSFPRKSVPSGDIMRLNHDRLARMTIGRLTAAEVGWPVSVDEKTAAIR